MVAAILPLTAQSAKVERDGKRLIGPVDLTIDGDGITVVIGPNGSGKTTLLRMLHGLAEPSDGSVQWSNSDDAARHQAFVFQVPVMLRRSVLENLIYPLTTRGMRRTEAMASARAIATESGLEDLLNRPATRLSLGERQRLSLARALISRPQVLFLDEPTASLDGAATRRIEDMLGAAANLGTRIILSTHDMGQARRMAREVIFLLEGSVHEMGPAADFFEGPQTPEAAAFLRGDIVD